MADWSSMTDRELADFCDDVKNIESESESEREKLQLELCKRHKWKWELPDGTVAYVPPDWKGK